MTEVKRCCDDIITSMYDTVGKRIDLDPNPNLDGYSFLDVKYCMYCGKRLECVDTRKR